jgi:hypothetical protein
VYITFLRLELADLAQPCAFLHCLRTHTHARTHTNFLIQAYRFKHAHTHTHNTHTHNNNTHTQIYIRALQVQRLEALLQASQTAHRQATSHGSYTGTVCQSLLKALQVHVLCINQGPNCTKLHASLERHQRTAPRAHHHVLTRAFKASHPSYTQVRLSLSQPPLHPSPPPHTTQHSTAQRAHPLRHHHKKLVHLLLLQSPLPHRPAGSTHGSMAEQSTPTLHCTPIPTRTHL